MRILVLRFDAPLMSFGSVRIDHLNRTDRFPYRAMLTGLLANALGLEHSDVEVLESLQRRLRYAARLDQSGEPLIDYQTVDLSQPSMDDRMAWTMRGKLESGGAGTLIRYRHYLAGALVTVVLTLTSEAEEPTLAAVEHALRFPARPLFLGRKCCIPSAPIFLRATDASSLKEAIAEEPFAEGALNASFGDRHVPAIWPAEEGGDSEQTVKTVRFEDRDWANAGHVGRRFYLEGLVAPPEVSP